ncbi:MAG: leucyl aminopeptidase family protein, partial [Bdellovibrionaceae bacterium]|nr:leucyl aminopeptidase family protein [Pseudobdellovibrionaceae bacterium]
TVNVQAFKQGKSVKVNEKAINEAQLEATAVQLARHLVNLPPNEANPETIEEMTLKQLNWPKGKVKINVWDDKKLKAENMNLLLAVGAGSATPPRMIHIQYRPQAKSNKKPVAFVGKGITFDTGGLDIKPSSAMRLMKKDMGGAASVLGLAYWVAHSGCKQPCDFYLALAENGVDAKAMRPSDVYMSRAGLLVEIDNTDAEGRLVLADAMDVAAKQTGANEPEYLIDLATLTGAIKVALGAEVAGLFCNDDKLANELEWAGQAVGESNWRMPLVQKYFGSLSSPFADFKNSGEGFGGAITAALFLEKFCNGKKWAHLDIYAWADRMSGPYASAGGNGQAVQTLIHWLKSK